MAKTADFRDENKQRIARSNTEHKLQQSDVKNIKEKCTTIFVSCNRNNFSEIQEAKDMLRKLAVGLKFEQTEPEEVVQDRPLYPKSISFVCNKVVLTKKDDNSSDTLDLILGAS